jgi:sRNA-binding protein
MIAPMSDVEDTPAPAPSEPGVMGNLPKTRPQRTSARRDAARSKAAAKPKAKAAAKPKPKPAAPKAKVEPAASKAKVEPARAPRQGFEAESDVEPGKTVQPPGGAELAASVVELIGELAQSGLNSGGRLLKDALSRLSGS